MDFTLELDTDRLSASNPSLWERVKPVVRSMVLKMGMASYHIDEADRLINSVAGSYVAARVLQIGMDSGDVTPSQYRNALYESEAHVIASASCLHSLSDVAGNVMWEMLQLAGKSVRVGKKGKTKTFADHLKPHRRYLASVISEMESNAIYANTVKAARHGLFDKGDYQRLRDYVNTTKHQSLIPAQPSVDLQEESHGILIAEFPKRGGGQWPECWGDDFIEQSYTVMHSFLNHFWMVMLAEIGA